MGNCSSGQRDRYYSAEGVLPTLLERFLVSKTHRINFESSIRGTEGELVLQIFKPLLYFEIEVVREPESAKALGELFKTLYILPNKERTETCFASDIFKTFLSEEISVESITAMRKGLDTEITLKVLLPYQKANNIELVQGVSNAEDANKLAAIDENYEAVFRPASTADAPPPAKVNRRSYNPLRRLVKSFNVKKMVRGKSKVQFAQVTKNNEGSWIGANSQSGFVGTGNLNFSPSDFKFMAPAPRPQVAPLLDETL